MPAVNANVLFTHTVDFFDTVGRWSILLYNNHQCSVPGFPRAGAYRSDGPACGLITGRRSFFHPFVRYLTLASSLIVLALCTVLGILFYYNYSNHDCGDIAYYLSAFHTMQWALPWRHTYDTHPFLSHHSEFLCVPLSWLFQAIPYPWFLLLLQSLLVASAWFLLRLWLLKTIADAAIAEYPLLCIRMFTGMRRSLAHGISWGKRGIALSGAYRDLLVRSPLEAFCHCTVNPSYGKGNFRRYRNRHRRFCVCNKAKPPLVRPAFGRGAFVWFVSEIPLFSLYARQFKLLLCNDV